MKSTTSIQLIRLSDNALIAETVQSAQTFSTRFRGLMAKPAIAENNAFILDPCKSIHTCFMRFNIDVIFLSHHLMVTGVSRNVRPWRMRLAPLGTHRVIEMRAGVIERKNIKLNDQLCMTNSHGSLESK